MDFDAADFPFIPTRTHNHQLGHQPRPHPRPDPHAHPRSQTYEYSLSHPHEQPATTSSTSTATTSSASFEARSSRRMGIPPASPEVITSLITSLSVLSSPNLTHGDPYVKFNSLSLPATPNARHSRSLSPDYAAYSVSPYSNLRTDERSDYFGEPPHPSLLPTSTLMSVSSSRDPRHSSRDSTGLPPLIGRSSATASRPSSQGSAASKNDDAQSIGNLSIERGTPPVPELKPRKSIDSWCKRTNRNSKSISLTSPREALLLRESDRKRLSPDMAPSGTSSGYFSGRTDSSYADDSLSGDCTTPNESPVTEVPCPIPARESSLRRTSIGRKLSTVRRSKRNSDGMVGEAIRETICELPEGLRVSEVAKLHRRVNSDVGRAYLFDVDENSPTSERASSLYQVEMYGEEETARFEDEGAPFPSVAQGRRRDEAGSDRSSSSRLSDRLSTGPADVVQTKRSSSRLKRLSAGLASPTEQRGSNEEQRSMPAGYERPKSADSVDDAVETYLCSPRLSQKIRHPQTGRVISFSEVGDPEGSAVFCCVGMGLTRYITAFYDELALTLKLRLITPDRPGVGASESCADGTATPLSWPDDVYAICQALKITKFSILAHSAGAIYALATALRMPQHIRGRIHLLAPWIPPSQMNVFGTSQAQPPSATLPTAQRILRALPTPILKAANSTFMSTNSFASSFPKNPRRKRKSGAHARDSTASSTRHSIPAQEKDSSNGLKGHGGGSQDPVASDSLDKTHNLDGLNAGDSNLLDTPVPDFEADKERQKTYDIRLTHAIWELATANANPAVDLLVCLERQRPIGFRYVDITRPVVIHHGSKDNRVPIENVKWLGRAMRRCEVRVLEQEGHGLMASASVMGSVLMEISKEWDDWIKATGADERKDSGESWTATITSANGKPPA